MDKMKLCPFCSGMCDGAERLGNNGYWVAVCFRCHARGPQGLSPENALKLWNERLNDNG